VVGTLILLRRSRGMSAQELASCLPPAPGAVLHIDVRALRDAGILDRLVGSTVNEEPEYKRFIAQTGFDYKSDLDGILAKLTPDVKYFVLTGRFDWKGLFNYATANGGTCHNGVCRITGSEPNRLVSFYALRPDVMALASGKVDGAVIYIKQDASASSVTFPTQPIWLTVPGSMFQQLEYAPVGTRPFVRALAPAENVMVTLGPQDNRFEAKVDVACKTAEDAAVLKAQLESLTATLKQMIEREKQTPNPADLSGLLTVGVFERQDRHVLGRWPVERALLESLGGS
jgi:hypothetical protein